MTCRVALLVVLLSLLAPSARAQDCDCDHTLALDVTTADGEALGIEAGDRVCVAAGERPFLRLSRFVGAADAPITVINCGGRVVIRNTDRAYALVVEGASRFVRVTGTGDPEIEHGFDVSAPDRDPYAGVGVWIQGRASDVEIDHMEVHDTGFAGVMAKTDPGCDDRPFWDDFVMRDVHLHHLWVHDTGGEGFYVGSTQTAGYMRECDGTTVTIPAHFLEGIEIDHVLVEDTEWDGAQVGFARSGCSVHDSVIRRVGSAGEMYQQQGLQLGAYSTCDVRRNVLSDGPAQGIIVLDTGDTTIADNVIARFGENGVYVNLRGLVERASHRFVHNTISGFGEDAIQVFGAGIQDSVAWNNFVIGGDASAIAAGGDVGIEIDHNVVASSIAEAGVIGQDDFHLGADSPARGAGRDLREMGFAIDLDGRARAMPPSAGAYEHSEDAAEIDAGVGSDASTTEAPSSSGCGCRVTRRADGSAPLALASLAITTIALRRRRR
ncbi:right-handed parallel beta-helix repeat-containing protein [Sandaracinus amylolyticus]|uniref:right-handed parallel beta-helix repeat-containing protein n=1 Tax=Sandaracinus amylolyticus TaxID=927083 RepID=UPI001F2F08DC|nr:right-handed parallel beta-helix repeat-containing protein [Sandaracinus amylolyticus]UJR84594.1 Hypothetical protein I5071_66730 [Sandaracinus amylolyticus]